MSAEIIPFPTRPAPPEALAPPAFTVELALLLSMLSLRSRRELLMIGAELTRGSRRLPAGDKQVAEAQYVIDLLLAAGRG